MLTIGEVERLRLCLLVLERAPGVPRLDVEWLRLRCEDTMRYPEDLQRASLRQLQRDLAAFVAEFPGLIPDALMKQFGGSPTD